LDFETLGPNLDTTKLEALAEMRYHDRSERSEVERRLAECEVAIVNKCDVDGNAIRASKRLKLIALTGTGSDNVDLTAAKQCGVAVANARGYCTTSLAQHVFALILTLTRQIEGYTALVRRGAWAKSGMFAMFDYPVRDLSGRTLGLVGSGTLGREVARLGECFGMRVRIAARFGTRLQLLAQRFIVLDDSVVDDRNLAVRNVRVRVDLRRSAVRGPSRVRDPREAGELCLVGLRCEIGDARRAHQALERG